MEKISIALASGNTIEKPLVSAFKGSVSSYVVLDNEINGTMGLPIILVAKYNNNRLEKITDQEEWKQVKESLRNIISGNQVDYIKIPTALTAEDVFFSQLTLPIASFESLKANYKPIEDGSASSIPNPGMPNLSSTPTPSPMPETPVEPTPVMPTPTPQVTPAVAPTPVIEPTNAQVPPTMATPMPTVEPVTPTPMPNVMPTPTPAVNPTPVNPAPAVTTPVEPTPTPVVPQPVAPVTPASPQKEPTETVIPVTNPTPNVTETPKVDFSVDKETFLKACENMFDALVSKFSK